MRTVLDDMEVRANGTASLQELERSFDVAVANSLHDSRQRRAERLSLAPKTPTSINVQSRVFLRNPDVVAEVLNRASGYCEKCGNKAPFMRASNGNPYLELHHRRRLVDGGEDTVENAFALCPNCHRESHYG
jgi:5-methylcytosine-specific restriction protein A